MIFDKFHGPPGQNVNKSTELMISDANYAHPKDDGNTCTSRYIQCWHSQEIYREIKCPRCMYPRNRQKCPYGHLFFDPVKMTCVPRPGKDTHCTEVGVSILPSNDTNTEEVEEVDSAITELLKPRPCSGKDYIQRGYCRNFFFCDEKAGIEEKLKCADSLLWNPDASKRHGGRCDYLKNLGDYTLLQYQQDPSCQLHITYFRYFETNYFAKYLTKHLKIFLHFVLEPS
jgi:hypothetical protein